jgi:putative acetyltransferase
MTEHITLRQETTDDIKEIYEVNLSAFGQDNEAKLVDALRNNSGVFVRELSIIAIHKNKTVGHILFTKINIRDENNNLNASLALAPIAVRPDFQKQGIGGQLIRKGFEVAKELGFTSIIVLGHKYYYQKFGFTPAETWNIKCPFRLRDNGNFMAIELVTDALKNISGMVVYPKEFETV